MAIPNYSDLIPTHQEEVLWCTCLALACAESPEAMEILLSAFSLPAPHGKMEVAVEKAVEIDGDWRRLDIFLSYPTDVGQTCQAIIEAKVQALGEHGDQISAYRKWLAAQDADIKSLSLLTLHPMEGYLEIPQVSWKHLFEEFETGLTSPPPQIEFLSRRLAKHMITGPRIDQALRSRPSHYPWLIELVEYLAKHLQAISSVENVRGTWFSGHRSQGAQGAEWNADTERYEYGIHWRHGEGVHLGLQLHLHLDLDEQGREDQVELVRYDVGDRESCIQSASLPLDSPVDTLLSDFKLSISHLSIPQT